MPLSPSLQKELLKHFTPQKKLEIFKDYLPVSAKYVDHEEIFSAVEAALALHFTQGDITANFEKHFSKLIDLPHCVFTNSGSSANLLAISSLTSPLLKERAITKGDEVITHALTFPTTVNPLFQVGAIPVFVDIDPQTLQIDPLLVEEAITQKTKAIMVAHTLGNPFHLEKIRKLCEQKGLWLVQDCCDALGATWEGRPLPFYGDIATFSFYPAHHLTTGEGGMVCMRDPLLKRIAQSFRDWGRDCYCSPGEDNRCGRRFESPLGEDHKYSYSHIGYNLKATDFQAAIGLTQLKKWPFLKEKREKNSLFLTEQIGNLFEQKISYEKARACWFGFPVVVDPSLKKSLIHYLESEKKIGTRPLFGGNLLKGPLYQGLSYRVPKPLIHTDQEALRCFWIGNHPRLEEEHLHYMVEALKNWTGFCKSGKF